MSRPPPPPPAGCVQLTLSGAVEDVEAILAKLAMLQGTMPRVTTDVRLADSRVVTASIETQEIESQRWAPRLVWEQPKSAQKPRSWALIAARQSRCGDEVPPDLVRELEETVAKLEREKS